MLTAQAGSIKEEIFFFPGYRHRQLLAFLHSPSLLSCSTGIVYVHPFAEEKNRSHSVVVKAARLFAASGIPVLRFDLSGCGDSEGDLQYSSVEDWLHDLDAAVEILHEKTGASRCLLWGLRLGAGLGLLRQQGRNDISGLILWQPVLDFSAHINQFLRQAISSEIARGGKGGIKTSPEDDLRSKGLVHVVGYPVTKLLYDSFVALGRQPSNFIPSVPTFILSISLMEQPAFVMKKYEERLQRGGTPVTFQHVTAEPFWDRYWQWECKKPSFATLQWLQEIGT